MPIETHLTRGDIGVWLISLPRDTDRREKVAGQLDAIGLGFTHFEAIDGAAREDDLLKRADPRAYERNMGSPLLPGKLGVYASHLAVWEALVQSGRKAALIFEDDVVLHEDFPRALDTALATAHHWDTIRFNCVRAKLPIRQGSAGPYRLNAYAGPFTGNAAYLIKRDVAARLLPWMWPQTRALDHELNRFFHYDFRQIGLEPFASHTDDGQVSTITGRNFEKVRKSAVHKRLPHFALKAGNYIRRAFWLARNGMIVPRSRELM